MRPAFSLLASLAFCVLLSLPGTSAAQSEEPLEALPPPLEDVPEAPLDMPLSGDFPPSADLQLTPGAPAETTELAAYIDGVVSSLQREHGLAALTVSVVKDDALLLAKAFGSSDLASARNAEAGTSLFRIGSVSKTFTWTAVMMLVERGQLDLDADLNSYLKQVTINEAFGQPVTMRHLMHHRAGFEDSLRLFAVADDDSRSLAELLAEHQPKRIYPPGLRTSYSNWGAALAAQVVEDVAGEPYGSFLQREILDPLGMHDTLWTPPAQLDATLRERLATGYKKQRGALGVQGYMQIGAYWPAGAIASTATDMARWMRFHLAGGELDGVRLLRRETHAQMWTRGFDDRAAAADVAHGFQDRHYRGLRLLGHGGGTAAFLTNMVLVPELRLGVFISQSSNFSRAPITHLPELVIDHVRGSTFEPALSQEAGEAEADAEAVQEFAGTYLQNRRVFSSFAAILGTSSTATITPVSADVLILAQGDESKQYRRVSDERDVFEAGDGGRIAFLRADGKVVAMADSAGVHTLEKVDLLQSPNTLYIAFGAALLLSLSSLLGFWWRLGRRYPHGFASSTAAFIGLVSALSVLAFTGLAALMVQQLSDFDLSRMAGNYPSEAMLHTHYAGWVVAGCGAAMLFALWPAWSGSGWGLWRRLHFSLFALVLASLGFLLWQWRVIGAPVY